jgi:hypothetical protein
MAKTHHKLGSLDVISRVFPSKFTSIFVSGDEFYTKICRTVGGISMIHQFHEFLKSNFRRVFAIQPYCALERSDEPQRAP